MSVIPQVSIKRIQQVITVLYDLGFGMWISGMKLQFLVPFHKRWMRISKKEKDLPCPIEAATSMELAEFPERFRIALERLGGIYVKLGQMLSLRADIVGEPIATELRKLQEHVPPFSFDQVETAVEKEFGKPLSVLFKKFERNPVGSASLAQVHHAVLPGGKIVAVKILRPNIEALAQADIAILQWFSKLLEDHFAFARAYQVQKIIEEFSDWTIRELNLLNEAVNIEHFRKLYEDEKSISIPAVEWTYTTPRVLTIEFSHGIPMDAFNEYRRLHCSRKKIAEIGTRLVYRQFFEHGFFHGDPHPGNFFVLPNNIVCLHDFGIVGHIDSETRRELIGCFVDFLAHDAEGAIQHLLHRAKTQDRSDIDEFKREVTTLLEKWFYGPTAGERLSTTFYNMIIAGARYNILFPSNMVLLAKAIVTMEGMALMLDPAFDIAKELKPYLSELLTMELRPEKLIRRGREVMLDTANMLDTIPEAARKFMKIMEKESMGIHLDTREFTDIKREIDRQSDIRFLTLFLVADILATAVLLHLEGVKQIAGVPLGAAGVIVGIVLAFMVVRKIQKGTN